MVALLSLFARRTPTSRRSSTTPILGVWAGAARTYWRLSRASQWYHEDMIPRVRFGGTVRLQGSAKAPGRHYGGRALRCHRQHSVDSSYSADSKESRLGSILVRPLTARW